MNDNLLSNYKLKSSRAFAASSVLDVEKDASMKAEKFILNHTKPYYVGVKNTNVIPFSLFEKLKEKGYVHHTTDKASHSGRAIDLELINPITGRWMTGSSSGTAINVFKEINDLGVGTDGGGSVLAPALALNLYSIISPLFFREHTVKFKKISTDGITFSPSIGFISKDINMIETILNDLNFIIQEDLNLDVLVSKIKVEIHQELFSKVALDSCVDLNYQGNCRKSMMEDLMKINFDKNILVSYEGPVDYFGYGDSVMGHYSKFTKKRQEEGHKYYLKVINMLGLSAITVPSQDLSSGYLIIFKSDKKYLYNALKIAKEIRFVRSELEQTYFGIERESDSNGSFK